MLAQPTISAPPPPTERLSLIFALLRHTLGNHPLSRSLAPALKWAIWSRFRSLSLRFAALVAKPPQPRPRRARSAPPRAAKRSDLPRRYGWLLHLLPGFQIGCARSQLRHLLAEPDMLALIAENPSVGRVLRPICHMVGLPIPLSLRLPKRPKPPTVNPAPKPARKSAPQKPEQKPERKPEQKPEQKLLDHLRAKYPPAPQRPMLPGHRYAPLKNAR